MSYPNVEALIEHTKYVILSEEMLSCCTNHTELNNDTLKNILLYIKQIKWSVEVFSQVWGSTALGFDGVGGSAMTEAYTTVIVANSVYYVYFDGRIAYKVENPTAMFFEDLRNHRLRSVKESQIYY